MKENIREKNDLSYTTEMILDDEDLLDEIIAFRLSVCIYTLNSPPLFIEYVFKYMECFRSFQIRWPVYYVCIDSSGVLAVLRA